MRADTTIQQGSQDSSLDSISDSSQLFPRDQSPSSTGSTWPNIEFLKRVAERDLAEYLLLRQINANDYIYFVEYCIEEAIWWLESRLVFEKYITVPADAFKKLFDDPDEALPGYGFLTEERNNNIVSRGFFDILRNYEKHASGTVPPLLGFLCSQAIDTNVQYSSIPTSQTRAKKLKKFLHFS
ncbi:uncharacterized protein DFL_001325 [Arthrobotrys flagrans]|uniref:Uncharacterized protein n=1 Tax=Arthrobotrys flagrans TaxID=97331 RepID=A0A437AGS0_ARTFL|nr:hypothetical protein DFL_001325 [Arthrobotrys flagrans]